MTKESSKDSSFTYTHYVAEIRLEFALRQLNNFSVTVIWDWKGISNVNGWWSEESSLWTRGSVTPDTCLLIAKSRIEHVKPCDGMTVVSSGTCIEYRFSSQILSKSEPLRQLMVLFHALCLELKSPVITGAAGREYFVEEGCRLRSCIGRGAVYGCNC